MNIFGIPMRRCFIIVLIIPVLLTAQEVPIQADDETAIRSGVKAYVAAFNDRDTEAVAAFWSPDAVYINRITNRQGIRQFNEAYFKETKVFLDQSIVNKKTTCHRHVGIDVDDRLLPNKF